MLHLFWELKQDARISGAEANVSAASIEAQNARQAVSYLENKIDKLSLICQAMWSLIQEKIDLTEEDLVKRVTDIDLEDGNLDGRYTNPVVKCKKCDAAISHQFKKCLFCGEEYTEGHAFSTI